MSDDRSKGKLHETDHTCKHVGHFRVIARRNKLLGRWAAGLMNLPRPEADAYAKQVVTADLDEPGDDDVIRKIMGDFERSGINISREELMGKMNELLDEARAQLQD